MPKRSISEVGTTPLSRKQESGAFQAWAGRVSQAVTML